MRSLLVGIAGGSGSGKTTLAHALAQRLGDAEVIPHDAYYRDLSQVPLAGRGQRNFDEPEALDNDRLIADLLALRAGQPIARPSYDFVTHARLACAVPVRPAPVILVEGILVLAIPPLRELFDVRVFVDASLETRLARRMGRDRDERGRTKASVEAQFLGTTQPMHALHVEPSKVFADLVLSGETACDASVTALVRRISSRLGN